ncbi:MAG: hypothetical protein KJO51_01480, partial [Gramella sp.]|nr:hypothetical protein [Christiangramia sp.]
MDLLLFRLLTDFGLVVLIWMVQLVVYPGLCFYPDHELDTWHKKYKNRIAFIVGPLMLAQLAIVIGQFVIDQNLYTWSSLGIVLAIWMLTFLVFVPLHNSINPDESCEEITASLVKKNWWRTFLWSVLFLE